MVQVWVATGKNLACLQGNVGRFRRIRYSTILLHATLWHDGRKHGMLLRISEHYLRLHSSCIWERFKREKLRKSKGVTLGFKVFDYGSLERFSWVGKHL